MKQLSNVKGVAWYFDCKHLDTWCSCRQRVPDLLCISKQDSFSCMTHEQIYFGPFGVSIENEI